MTSPYDSGSTGGLTPEREAEIRAYAARRNPAHPLHLALWEIDRLRAEVESWKATYEVTADGTGLNLVADERDCLADEVTHLRDKLATAEKRLVHNEFHRTINRRKARRRGQTLARLDAKIHRQREALRKYQAVCEGDLWAKVRAQQEANAKLQRKYETVKGDLLVRQARVEALIQEQAHPFDASEFAALRAEIAALREAGEGLANTVAQVRGAQEDVNAPPFDVLGAALTHWRKVAGEKA